MTSCRIASSSTPIYSMSSGVRWAMGWSSFFWMAVTGLLGSDRVGSVVDVACAGGGVDAGLDADTVARHGGGDLSGAEVGDRALAQRQDAAVADAHPAAARHQHPRLLGGVEDRRGPVGLDG